MREYLSPAMVRRALSNSYIVPLGIRCDEIDEYIKNVKKNDKFTLFFGGRLTANKQWQKVLKDYEKFFSFGRDLNLVICAPLGETSLFKAERWGTWGEINLGLPRDEYLKKLVSCHVSMSNSIEEGFTVGIVEQIYAGLVVILPKRDWVKGLLGEAYKIYPFIYNGGSEEAYVVLKYVFENYGECVEKMKPIREYIKKNYNISVVSRRTFEIIENYIKELRKRVVRSESKEIRELIDRVVNLFPNGISFKEFNEKLRSYTDKTVSGSDRNYRSGFPSKWQFYQFLIKRGYVDNYKFPNPVLVKEVHGGN
jgi:glycosyltransferase involved in cell wall biosynthesis